MHRRAGLIELAEAEGDEAVAKDAVAALVSLAGEGQAPE